MALPEGTDIFAKTAPHIHDEFGLQADEVETVEHAGRHFAQQKVGGVGPRRSTIELPAHGAPIPILHPGRMA